MEVIKNPYVIEAQKIILANIPLDQYAVFVFGSRAGTTYKEYSDLDVGVYGTEKISQDILYKVRELLDASTIPYKVDIVDFNRVSNEFKEIALKKIQIWNRPEHLHVN
jgi:predicted nucleotidyltransferase